MRPPFLFLPAGEKETRICALRAALRAVALRNAAAAAGARCKEKEGLGQQTCSNLVSILRCSLVEHGAAWCPVVTARSLGRAPRWCGARSGEQCTNVPAPLAQHSNDLRSKGRRTATPKPAAKALFFFSTEHGALLFLRTRRKRRGGCISNKRYVGALPNKRMVFQEKGTTALKGAFAKT